MVNVSFCRLGRMIPEPFAGYVLPYVRTQLAQPDAKSSFTVLGAIWNGLACATAVASWDDEEKGSILSLFVDPKARHCGIAGRMVDLLVEEGKRRGVRELHCTYILKDDELADMDALFLHRGAELDNNAPVCGINSDDFVDSPLLGPALRPGWKRSASVALFSELSEEQLRSFDRAERLPWFLRPSELTDKLDPSLSAAWLSDGKPTAFVLGFQCGERMFCQSAVWRGPEAPSGSFRALVGTQANQCWYRSGGSFVFFVAPINSRSAAMAEWFTGGNYEPYGQREAVIPLGE